MRVPWDDLPNVISPTIDRQFLLAAPSSHVIMVSFSWTFESTGGCASDVVELYKAGRTSAELLLLLQMCGSNSELVSVFEAHALRVRFVIRSYWKYIGFRMSYSFHKVSGTYLKR